MADNNSADGEKKIYDCPGKVKSEVWRYFGFYKVGQDIDTKKAVCRLCRKEYINNGM